jgi:hypothetical protein
VHGVRTLFNISHECAYVSGEEFLYILYTLIILYKNAAWLSFVESPRELLLSFLLFLLEPQW